MTLGVVTSAWGGYGRYLPEWAASIDAQTVRPDLVTVLDAGLGDPAAARRALEPTGLNWQIVQAPYTGMGAARNAAITATPTEWIVHLDADDVFLPHAVADILALTGGVDVVAVGAVRDGREICWPEVSAAWILSGRQGAMSGSAFRRALWERVPFITRNDWVDSAFWVGLAHQGARFAGTARPGFEYRPHPDSHSATLPPADRRRARQQWRKLCRRWAP